eukprot:CAMPEP_0197689764 /NCGR_PEP_ID=MMETSP1338-20131121/107345_1 /TAXON_ID=43686 ORGANISM="Pelagodinium beii, Strain RCC1491" /NCGR_SAMPLE_ID=MMETSP1338 /ASSEMBLY_ACC=CAM_ASM_000754 /LENGTH=235 /DNA_ID=CAMNT_0043272137 /DNA_START=155 /DNA_END=862 /DNA_ORIENTATION=-
MSRPGLAENDRLVEYAIDELSLRFGNLDAAFNTLFRCIVNGIDWDSVAQALAVQHWGWAAMLTAYVALCTFAVLNVMTGVFCNSAIQGAEKDQELMLQAVQEELKRNKNYIAELFKSLDIENTGSLTLRDFERSFEDPNVKTFLHSLDLDTGDAWSLFKMLDTEGQGQVDTKEFVEGCMKLKGSAKAFDLAGIAHENKWMKKKVDSIDVRVCLVEELVAHTHEMVEELSSKFSVM